MELLSRLFEDRSGALSIQVLADLYAAATKRLAMTSQEVESVLADLGGWTIHQPVFVDLIGAARLQRRYGISWWDALAVQSANEAGANVVWSEDLNHGQKYGSVTARTPFS